MFNSTHTLVGIQLSRAGLDQIARQALWTAVIAANLPDLDILTALAGTAQYIDQHRGLTHTIAGIAALSLLLAAVMHVMFGQFRRHLVVALIAMATHPLLDLANTYGIRPFLPFNSRWFYGDALFVIDPFIDLLLLAALVAGNRFQQHRRTLAIGGLALALLYVGARVELRNAASFALETYLDGTPPLHSSAVAPGMINPFAWTGIVQTGRDLSILEINVLRGVGRQIARFTTAADSQEVLAAKQTRTAAVFATFARFPVVQVHPLSVGSEVIFFDARFYRESGVAFGATVRLDPNLKVVSEEMSFNESVSTDALP